MIYLGLNGYDEFKELFGVRETGNGKTVRRNTILLSFVKNGIKTHFDGIDQIKSMTDMYDYIMTKSRNVANCNIRIMGYFFHSNTYQTDNYDGICYDGDCGSIRYVSIDSGRVYKMKAGKFLRKIILETEFGKQLDEQSLTWVCEKFSRDWLSSCLTKTNEYKLVVDDDFKSIYSSDCCNDSFNSCMTDDGQYEFYSNAVQAKAASIRKNGKIYARCVLFTDVHEIDSDKIWRLAERQYSSNEKNELKQVLINMLIAGNHIDGYKQVGVDCHSNRAFIGIDGSNLSDRRFWIRCDLHEGDTLSYQDSFVNYNLIDKTANNYKGEEYSLDTTNSEFEADGGEDEYDSYHETYCSEVRDVLVWDGYDCSYREMTCNVNDMDDFNYSDYHELYLNKYNYSNKLNDYLRKDMSSYCEIADDYFPDDKFEYYKEKYKEDNWNYDEYKGEYTEDGLVEVYVYVECLETYVKKLTTRESRDEYFTLYNGEYHDVVDDDGVPFGVNKEVFMEA